MTDKFDDNKLEVIKGTDRLLSLQIIIKGTNKPFVLSPTPTEIIARFLLEDQSSNKCIEKKLSVPTQVVIVTEATGQIAVELDAADTLLLKEGKDLDFEVEITQSGKKSVAEFLKVLTVRASICA